jgi:Zn-dependent protease
MTGWWISDLWQAGQISLLASWLFWVIAAITLHELAHGWAAIWQGDDTPRELGHMTPNPFVHMGGMSLLMLALFGFAWGLMPTDPSRYRWGRRGRIVVAGAGPAMNVLLAFICLTLLGLYLAKGLPASTTELTPGQANLVTFLKTGGWLNLFLAAFNLLPVYPLDGSSVLAGISRTWYRWMQNPGFQNAGWIILLLFFFTDLDRPLFTWTREVAAVWPATVARLVGG